MNTNATARTAPPIRVVDVRHLRSAADRATVVYVGRAFAGWPRSWWANSYRPRVGFDAVEAFRRSLLAMPAEVLERELVRLWEATEHGAKPLGCWCCNATVGDGSAVVCHAQVIAELLRQRFGGSEK